MLCPRVIKLELKKWLRKVWCRLFGHKPESPVWIRWFEPIGGFFGEALEDSHLVCKRCEVQLE